MKSWPIAIVALLSLASANAVAQTCSAGPPDTRLSPSALQTLVQNKYVCVGAYPTATWNEYHTGTSGGAIVDYKLGATDPVDPTATVGNYTINKTGKDGIVTYNYTGGGSYSYYAQLKSGSQYYFCQETGGTVNGTVFTVTIQASHC